MCSHYVREKKFVQANSKVQIVLKKFRAEVKCIKKKSCRDMRLKKKFVPQKCYIPPPLPGFLMVRPLHSLDSFISQFKISQRFTVSIYLYLQSLFRPPTRPIHTFLEREVKPYLPIQPISWKRGQTYIYNKIIYSSTHIHIWWRKNNFSCLIYYNLKTNT